MRPFALALLALALSASPARAAVIEIEDHFCGCDGSSGETDTRGIVVTAAPGEVNVITVRRVPRGIVIEDSGAPLTGRCRPMSTGGRFCRGEYDGVDVQLGDGDDRLEHSTAGGAIGGGPGDDDIRVTTAHYALTGGPGADRMDATGALDASVSYADRTEAVTVRLNGLADDGEAGEGDNVIGAVTNLTGGAGSDVLEAGAAGSGLFGGDGADRLVGSPERDTLSGGAGDDELIAGDGDDFLSGEGGADVFRGGPGIDEVSYNGAQDPLRLTIGGGADDGTAGEGDDIGDDVENLTGGDGDDLLVGSDGPNRLYGGFGLDVLRGLGGPDRLIGWGDGDELDAGAGRDVLEAGARDRPLLRDGERDRLNCRSHAPRIEADVLDRLRTCAPAVDVVRKGRVRAGSPLPLVVSCPGDSAVPCRGRLWLSLLGGRRVSRILSFGPIEPGRRSRMSIGVRVVPRAGRCLYATAVARRRGRPGSWTTTRNVLFCPLR